MAIIVAIPVLDEAVAPCFEAATRFEIIAVNEGQAVATKEAICDGPEGYRRIRLLQIHEVKVLICNGIKGVYRDMLTASGVTVIQKVSMPAEQALNRYLQGELVDELRVNDEASRPHDIPYQELVDKARALFTQGGYSVVSGPGEDSFLVDLIAETRCPVCDGMVRVAICCGAHTYRPTQEITEFYRAPLSDFNARVYISPTSPGVADCCEAYGIELVDPDAEEFSTPQSKPNSIPILRGPVVGHEKASQSERSE